MLGGMVALTIIVVLALASRPDPHAPSLDSAPLIAALIAQGNTITPLRTVVTDPPWDVVCLQYGYSRPSRVLQRHLGARAETLAHRPYDIVTGEHELGLIFVDFQSATAHTYTFRIGNNIDTDIRSLDGPTCLEKEDAWYMIERVQGHNTPYNVLTFLSME